MATETLQDLQRRLSAALALNEEGQARRGAAAERRRTAEKEFAAAEPAARLAHERAATANATARAVSEATNRTARDAHFALQAVSARREREVAFATAELIETSPPAYGAFGEWLESEFGGCRHGRFGKSGVARLEVIRAAQQRIAELQLDPREDPRADQHVEKMRKSLPTLVES